MRLSLKSAQFSQDPSTICIVGLITGEMTAFEARDDVPPVER
jgi:hypothetical protein